MKTLALTVAVAAALLATVPGREAAAQDRVVIEGDPAPLQALIAAQETNRASYPKGRLVGKVKSVTPTERLSGDVAVTWEGKNSRTDLTYTRTASAGTPGAATTTSVVETAATCWHFFPSSKLLQQVPAGGRSYPAEFKVRPQDLWFSMERLIAWRDYLDPEKSRKRNVERVVVRREGDEVLVTEHYANGAVFVVKASLTAGGNVVSFETPRLPTAKEDAAGWMVFRGRYEWDKTPSGVPWVRRLECWQSPPGDPDGEGVYYIFEASAFEPSPRIPKDVFTMAGLNAPKGTRVEVFDAKNQIVRSYAIGGRSPAITAESLDELARELKDDGFAAGKEK